MNSFGKIIHGGRFGLHFFPKTFVREHRHDLGEDFFPRTDSVFGFLVLGVERVEEHLAQHVAIALNPSVVQCPSLRHHDAHDPRLGELVRTGTRFVSDVCQFVFDGQNNFALPFGNRGFRDGDYIGAVRVTLRLVFRAGDNIDFNHSVKQPTPTRRFHVAKGVVYVLLSLRFVDVRDKAFRITDSAVAIRVYFPCFLAASISALYWRLRSDRALPSGLFLISRPFFIASDKVLGFFGKVEVLLFVSGIADNSIFVGNPQFSPL